MAERTLIARVRADEKDPATLIVASPVVAMADGAPKPGAFLNPLDRVIALKVLHQRYALRLPRDVQGRIVEVLIPNAFTPVAYDQPLARLDPRAAQGGDPALAAGAAGRGASAAGEAAGAGLILVTAPSDGIFYRRPTPDAPAYVERGAPVAHGTVLGLVEVMKCFNQITYGGPGYPERGEIVKVLAEDAAEVQFGQELFWVKPLDR
jgi:acetyl-CoA carboxylase biotin carboxyl carrier protein